MPLHDLVSAGDVEGVRALLDTGVDVNARDETQTTPLHRAAWKGQRAIVQMLLDLGAMVNARDSNLWTPLHCAALNGNAPIINLLLKHGADVNAQEFKQRTALDFATQKGWTDVIRLLLDRKENEVESEDQNSLLNSGVLALFNTPDMTWGVTPGLCEVLEEYLRRDEKIMEDVQNILARKTPEFN